MATILYTALLIEMPSLGVRDDDRSGNLKSSAAFGPLILLQFKSLDMDGEPYRY